MAGATGRWFAGLALSGVLHIGAAGLYFSTHTLEEAPDQPKQQSRLQLDTVTAPTQEAEAKTPDSTDAEEEETQSTFLGAGAVPETDAIDLNVEAHSAQTASPLTGDQASALRPIGGTVTETIASTETIENARLPETQSVTAALPDAGKATEQSISSEAIASKTASSAQVSASQMSAVAMAPTPLDVAIKPAEQAPKAEVTQASAIPQAKAQTTSPVSESIAEATPTTQTALSASSETDTAKPLTASGAIAQAANVQATVLPEVSTVAERSPPITAAASTRISSSRPASASTPIAEIPKKQVAASTPDTEQASVGQAPSIDAPLSEAGGASALESPNQSVEAVQPELPAASATAQTAWRFGDRLVTDKAALDTIQAFMNPQAPEAIGVRDDLSQVLTDIECARVSATFLPETGELEMRGHIPDPALQAPLLEAMRQSVGEGIPVKANLLHLPAPQCGALTGIAQVGLPQSTDQFTNSRLIGASAHARAYNYAEGQRLQFDLVAPDYDSYIYVDYFNASGEVIHLTPNEFVALELAVAKDTFGIGKDRPGRPGLRITIGPPYGQEIAVAFASSHPLYEGLRPIVEPAVPYLDYLQGRVSKARAANPDFKGEWVYFFITTAPATQ